MEETKHNRKSAMTANGETRPTGFTDHRLDFIKKKIHQQTTIQTGLFLLPKFFNPLSPSINIKILQTDLHTFR